MNLLRALYTNSTTFYSQVLFDPILTPIFTAILGGGGFSLFGGAVSFTYAGIATAIASTAITFGLQYLLGPKPPKPEDGRAPLTQSTPYQIYGVGTNRIAGAYMLWESKNGYLYSVTALCGHRIHGVRDIYLHDEKITRTGNVVDITADEKYGLGSVIIETRDGLAVETPYAFITADLGADGIWTNNHIGHGTASLGMSCRQRVQAEQPKGFPYGPPNPSVIADMARVWDFRNSSQSAIDPSTWGFSQNPVLQYYWHICFNRFGLKLDYTKVLLPIIEEMKAEADICDQQIARVSGGTENRYECNVWATTETDPKAVTNAIKASCDGWDVCRGDGVHEFRVGLFRESLVSVLTDDDIVGHVIDENVLEDEEINRLVPKFTYPATDYTSADTDFFESTADQLIAGRILADETDLRGIHNWRQARRVAKRQWLKLQQKRRGTFDVRLSGINAIYSRWVRIQSTRRIPRMNGVLIENQRSTVSLMQGGFQMDWTQHPENIDAWDPVVDEGKAPPVPIKPGYEDTETPTIDNLFAVGAAGSVFLRVTLIEPGRSDMGIRVRYRIKDVGGGTPGEWVEHAFNSWVGVAGVVVLSTPPVPANVLLEVQAALVGTLGTYGAWSVTEEITSMLDSTPTGPVTNLVATPTAGQIAFTWNAPNSANYASTVFYLGTTNVEASATLQAPAIYGAPSAAAAMTRTGLTAGTYYVWVRARNVSEVESASIATGAIVVP